jgi:hypothetical protein
METALIKLYMNKSVKKEGFWLISCTKIILAYKLIELMLIVLIIDFYQIWITRDQQW